MITMPYKRMLKQMNMLKFPVKEPCENLDKMTDKALLDLENSYKNDLKKLKDELAAQTAWFFQAFSEVGEHYKEVKKIENDIEEVKYLIKRRSAVNGNKECCEQT